jgi:hypothetical protein
MALGFGNTYDSTSGALREDLLDLLTNLTPKETQLISGLGTSTANSIRHEWLIDTLTAVKDNSQLEGASITYHNVTNPSRLANYTQIFKQGYKVSDSERAVDEASFSDRYNYEKTKALAMLKNDMEYAVMRGSMVSGSGSGARKLCGVKASLSLITSQSGTSMTEAMLNDYLQLVWDNTSIEVDAIYVDMYMKRKISGFTAGLTKNINADDKRLVLSTNVYEADAAKMVKLFAHRYVTISGTDTNHDLLGITEDKFKIAYLRKPEVKEADGTGYDFSGGNIVTELTLQTDHYNAGVWATQLL